MTECHLDDDDFGPEVHAVEAASDGEIPQALCVRVGPVYYESSKPAKEPGVWIEYQEHHERGPLTGPVLLTPRVWRQLNRAVERRLRRREPWWKRLV